MSSSNLVSSMKALELGSLQDDKNSEVIHDKNNKPISKPRVSTRPKNAEGSSAKLPSKGQRNTYRPSTATARNAEPRALGTSHRASKPQASKPQAPKPQASKPQAPKPQASKPQASKPQAPKPQAHKPQAHKPQAPKPKAQDPDKSWSMYPELHDSVCRLLEEDDLFFTFFAIDEDRGSIEEKDTFFMGRFKCPNKACPKAVWTSKAIAFTIRMYPGQQYNARAYHQRCEDCGSLSKPFPGDSYAERIAYRLKTWSGIEMDRPAYTARGGDRPHQSALCEGCRHGHCMLSYRR